MNEKAHRSPLEPRDASLGENPLRKLKMLLEAIYEAHMHGFGMESLPVTTAGFFADWLEALDCRLTRFCGVRIPSEQRMPYIEKLIDEGEPWLVYMSDGGYTRIAIDLTAEGDKIWAAELTDRSRPRWEEMVNG